ncbi:LemA family protein [Intestinibacter sp.]
MTIGIILVVVIVLVAYFISTYNNLVKESFSTMDVYLKKRFDLIPNLVNIVKKYTKYESETLANIVKQRTSSYSGMSPEGKMKLGQNLNTEVTKILAIAEQYPELKANENFIKLSESLSKVEDEIAKSRTYYNATVRDFNNAIEVFPNNLISGMFGFRRETMFEIAHVQRQNVKVFEEE